MGASVPRSAVNDFLATIGVPTRDTCRVEIGVHEIRVHSYDRLDDGEYYLGPDGVATKVDVLPIDPAFATVRLQLTPASAD